ncbi:DivIVA domain-containing protein [Oscillatoria sp. FACHB-1406]|uniref:DivIVA domain-containing protein n=1 Tax=Oscillatoria sp. FACHB-1406 TaxID=2692846 RepID=UPI001F5573D2|nr:DivIVA domain-containing protein [Oscillatoria sp. FACHB-1406]
MLRQKLSRGDPEPDEFGQSSPSPAPRSGNIDIQAELNRLEDIILYSPHIPLTKRTLIDEEQLLEQLDLVRVNLPSAFADAVEIVRQKEEILLQAEEYAQDIIAAAQQRAAEILDELGIVRQAELEAARVRHQVQQECEQIQQSTLAEIEQLRARTHQEIEQLRQTTLNECEDIQDGADEYADAVLSNIEQQLGEMLRIIHNGRQQLRPNSTGGTMVQSEAGDSPPPANNNRKSTKN